MKNPIRLLFVCTGNSCRSQMAEGFARALGREILEPYSAGTHPTRVHPLTIEVMRERGVDISGHYSKGLAEVPSELDLVVTVCDQAKEACPVFPGARRSLHWSIPDPVAPSGDAEELRAVFRRTRDDIEARVSALVGELASGSASAGAPDAGWNPPRQRQLFPR